MRWLLAATLLLAVAAPAAAQTFTVRGFGDIGNTTFTAAQSFAAVLGSRQGLVVGGGVEATVARNVFVSLRASRFTKSGHRVFVFQGERFDLGTPDDVRITPVEVSAGYRFSGPRSRVAPYVGGGLGWFRYEETSRGADAAENVSASYRGYHLLGGAEFRMNRWLAVAGEAAWATVPNALGQNPTSVARAFDETDLGGTTLRAKIVVGSW